jgi:hypothetical protein
MFYGYELSLSIKAVFKGKALSLWLRLSFMFIVVSYGSKLNLMQIFKLKV